MTAPAAIPRGKNGRAPVAIPIEPDPTIVGQIVAEIPVASIDVGPNVRTQPGDLDELVASIKEHGVLQPIKVRAAGDRFVVVWGQRRFLAAGLAGLETIPSLIEQAGAKSADKLAVEQLVENFHRADLNPIDEAVALRAILDADTGLTQVSLAQRLGRSAPWVSNSLRLLELAEPVQELMATGQLGTAQGKALAALEADEQTAIAKEVVKSGGTVRDLDGLIRERQRALNWKKEEAAARAKKAKAALDAIVAKKLPLTTQILVSGYELESVLAGLKKAGFTKVTSTSYYYGSTPPPSICKCTAVRLDVGYGSPRITRHCVDDDHRKEQQKRETAKQQREREASEAARDAARAAVAAELEAHPLSLGLARHILWRLDSPAWEKDKEKRVRWERICALSLEQLHAKIATGFYSYNVPPIDVAAEAAEAAA